MELWGLVRYMYNLYVVTINPTNYPTLTSKCSTNTGADYSMVPAFYQVHPNLTSSPNSSSLSSRNSIASFQRNSIILKFIHDCGHETVFKSGILYSQLSWHRLALVI